MNKLHTMKRLAFPVLAILVALGFYACNDDQIEGPQVLPPTVQPTDINFPTTTEVTTASITGQVIDSNDQAIADATVICVSCADELTVTTEEDGSFSFNSVEINGSQAYLSVTYPGAFDAFRRLALVEDRQNYTRIKLRDRTLMGQINSNTGGTISMNNGAQLILPENGIIDANGNRFDGDYEVYMAWIDPTAVDLTETMMGDLSGIDTEGNLMGLSTFGMLQIELAANGAELNLSGGAEAELQFPVPTELRSMAPAVIPLWSYNEEYGYWVEEGQAELVGDMYVGTVTHFSTWNVDSKFDPINLCGDINIITRGTEVGLSYFEIQLSGDSFNSVGGWLCDDGSFNFLNIPSGEPLTIEIINYCGEVVHTEDLGPYSENTKLETIVITNEEGLNEVTVQGNALTCDGAVVKDGRATIAFDNRTFQFPLNEDGEFLFAIPICNNLIGNMTIFNFDDQFTSASIPISNVNNSYIFDDLSLCTESEEFYYLEYTEQLGETHSFWATNPEDVYYDLDDDAFLFVGVFNSPLVTNIAFNYQGELRLNEVIFNETGASETTYLFTEIGPVDASGRPSVISGSIQKTIFAIDTMPEFDVKASFRIKS